VSSHSARFGLSLVVQGSATQTIEAVRRPADVGFDVVLVPDHLGLQAPMPTLVVIADAVPSIRISRQPSAGRASKSASPPPNRNANITVVGRV
jgi:hypothetical protein